MRMLIDRCHECEELHQCEVKDVLRGKYNVYRIMVVPVLPLADEWGVDYTEQVRTVVGSEHD